MKYKNKFKELFMCLAIVKFEKDWIFKIGNELFESEFIMYFLLKLNLYQSIMVGVYLKRKHFNVYVI